MQRWSKWTICAVTYRRETRRRGNLSWRSRKCYGKVKRRRHRWRKASETAADIAALWSSSPGTSSFTAKSAQSGQGFQFVFCFIILIYDYDKCCENNLSLKLKRLILILVQLWTAQSDARHLGADVCCVVLSSVDIGYRNIKCDVNADVVHRCATLAFGTCSHSLSPFFFLFFYIYLTLSLSVRRTVKRSWCQDCSRRWTPSVPSWRRCRAPRWSFRERRTSWCNRGRILRCSWHASKQRPREGTHARGRMTVTHIPSPVIVFKLCLFRVQISNTCHCPDYI